MFQLDGCDITAFIVFMLSLHVRYLGKLQTVIGQIAASWKLENHWVLRKCDKLTVFWFSRILCIRTYYYSIEYPSFWFLDLFVVYFFCWWLILFFQVYFVSFLPLLNVYANKILVWNCSTIVLIPTLKWYSIVFFTNLKLPTVF